jgi:hypothetical protein
MRESLARPNYKGEDYFVEKSLIENRTHNRKCTDCLFTVVFLAFIVLMAFICGDAIKNENY